MTKLEINFDRERCLDCAARPHCRAGILAADFAEHTIEAELDKEHLSLNEKTTEIISYIRVEDSASFEASLDLYIHIAKSLQERFELLSNCIDQLLDEGIKAHQRISDEVLYDDQLDQIRDRFVDRTNLVPVRVPTKELLRVAITDVVEFQDMDQCLQDVGSQQ